MHPGSNPPADPPAARGHGGAGCMLLLGQRCSSRREIARLPGGMLGSSAGGKPAVARPHDCGAQPPVLEHYNGQAVMHAACRGGGWGCKWGPCYIHSRRACAACLWLSSMLIHIPIHIAWASAARPRYGLLYWIEPVPSRQATLLRSHHTRGHSMFWQRRVHPGVRCRAHVGPRLEGTPWGVSFTTRSTALKAPPAP